MKSVYKPHVSLNDGWSRGFKPEQTYEEANNAGYSVNMKLIVETFEVYNERMEAWVKVQEESDSNREIGK